MPRHGSALAVVVATACVAVGLLTMQGCSRAPEAPAPWFTGEYLDPTHAAGTMILDVRRDGTFTLRLGEREGSGRAEAGREIARGSWKSLGDGVELDGGEWSAALVTDDIRVTLLDRSDTLHGLRWTVTRGAAPLDSARFVARAAFADFVNPPGGSGTSGGGL